MKEAIQPKPLSDFLREANEIDIPTKFGFILIVDALGIRSLDLDQCKKFVHARDAILNALEFAWTASMPTSIETMRQLHASLGVPREWTDELTSDEAWQRPNPIVFGDTLLFAWPCEESKIRQKLAAFAAWTASFIRYSLELGIAFRGAFSVGKYVTDGAERSFLGPAVTDAAAWYERCNWIGVCATPDTYSSFKNKLPSDSVPPVLFVEYPVPCKTSDPTKFVDENLLTVNWAIVQAQDQNLRAVADVLAGFPKPKGVEQKYSNTQKYYDSVSSFHG